MLVKDPICGMMVDPEKAPAKAEYKGRTFYFCALVCKATFAQDPDKYLEETVDDEEHHHRGH